MRKYKKSEVNMEITKQVCYNKFINRYNKNKILKDKEISYGSKDKDRTGCA